MKFNTDKIIFSDKYTIITAALVILAAIFTITAYISINHLEKENKKLTGHLSEIQGLQKELIQIKDIAESKERKIGLTKITGVVPALQQLLDSLGLKAKAIKPLEKKKIKEFTEEDAELEIEGINLNQIVNLLYRIENSPFPLKVKNAAMKTAFENQNVFILNITASLIDKTK